MIKVSNTVLVKEWHPFNNGNLTPDKVTVGSNKKVWWKCHLGHEWQAYIYSRNSGSGCPFCSGNQPSKENCLQVVNPTLAKQWHPRNIILPSEVTPNSCKKVWWLCEKGHEWEATIKNRNLAGRGCPYCSGQKACIENCLATINPDLSLEWHNEKNKELTPYDVTKGKKDPVWWICNRGHEWKNTIRNRLSGQECPYCNGRYATEESNLAKVHPILVKQWHPSKNEKLTPQDFTPNSNRYAWWLCEKGHEWRASINSRSRGTGCPICAAEKGTSMQEQTLYFYLKKVFPNALNRFSIIFRNKKIEIDVYVPDINLALEYDGYYFHRKKSVKKRDFEKNNTLWKSGIKLIRLRESGLAEINMGECTNVSVDYNDKRSLISAIQFVFNYIIENYDLEESVKRRIESVYNIDLVEDEVSIIEQFVQNEKKNSIINNSKLVKEWHPLKNGILKPEYFQKMSNKKVWWLCNNGHEWLTAICSRSQGTNCPYCSNKKVGIENCLATVNPDLAIEWHPLKKGDYTPYNVTSGSNKNIWWKCIKGHEWQNRVAKRNRGEGCPYCSGRRVSESNCLALLRANLIKEWHPVKNRDLTPYDVTVFSSKKVWWICKQGHEWEARVYSRSNGTGCRKCYLENSNSKNKQ